MNPRSPLDAVSPAFSRARTVLLPPGRQPGESARFRFWFLVKVTLVGAFTQPGAYGASIAVFIDAVVFALAVSGAIAGFRVPGLEAHRGDAGLVLALAALGAVGLAVWIVLGWLWCRLRFTLFEMVTERHGGVGLAWSRYATQAWRYLGLTVLVSFAFLLLLAATAGPFLFHLYGEVHSMTPQQIAADPFLVIGHVLPLYGIIFGAALFVAIADAVLQDFIVPPMALEDTAVEEAFRRFIHLVRTQPGSVALYFLLRFALQIGLAMAGGIVLVFALAVLGLGGFGLGFALYHLAFHAGTQGTAVFVTFCVVAAAAGLAIYLLAIVLLNGSIAIFRQCYAVEYYGSFYPVMGSRLEPPGAGDFGPPAAPNPHP
jgi:hypothetical protein